MSVQSWQIACPRCGWSNSGAEKRCGKCGQSLRTAPGLLVAGESAGNVIAPKAPPKRVVQPGGFFPRLIAAIIDALILAVILVPVYYLWRAQLSQVHLDPNAVNQPNAFSDQLTALGGSALAGSSMQQLTQIGELLLGLEVLVLFYFVGSSTILSGSPGQLVMNLRVVDHSAKGIGFGRGLMRYVFKSVFAFLAPVSVLMVALGKDKRAIHDRLAGTYVIQYLDPRRAHEGDSPAIPVAAVPAAAAGAAVETAFLGAAPPRPGQAEARAANAAARAATMAGPAARATLATAQPGPAAPPSDPNKVPTPAPLTILPDPSPAPAAAPPAPFYAVPAPPAAPPSIPDESSFERYTPPPMPGPPTSPVRLAAAPPAAAPAETPSLPSIPAPPVEEALAMPPLPPPAPAPNAHGPAEVASGPPEAAPEAVLTPGPGDPYPLPFAPLPPVIDRPDPTATTAASGE